ncbi:heme-binding protein [Limnoraphis robusta]|uniref:Heme-binding protein n=1 Tax=Limnoraphis robusta CCNP1315 TaxID=3110306 RepID=A0ABU5U1H3_9CYAN|nr:heme-binding protein [Limnoraphis robusta]MEA5520767.1 heme-binding protein [Limnoraphis robusta CCNP1315]MEA5549240.1 heme-binding protein [Limnoraphis robusta CCNP1324]
MPTSLPQGFPEPTQAGVVEIKYYPAYRGVTYSHTGDLTQATKAAFNPLFQHISSNNISMTTPVEARYQDASQADVSFLYSSPNISPQQVQPGVQVVDTQEMMVVSIGIQGAYTWESYEIHRSKLENWLQQHPEYQVVGSPRRLFYNSPMTPESLKYSEVQIPIQKKSEY